MNKQKVITITHLLAVVALLLGTVPVFAHHSFAMFDRDKKIMITGVIKEVQWANPHTWIQIVVTNDKGEEQEWSIECGSPNMMTRRGWKSSTLKPGDKVGMVFFPMRDGTHVGSLYSVTLSDGRILGAGGGPAPETGNAPPPN